MVAQIGWWDLGIAVGAFVVGAVAVLFGRHAHGWLQGRRPAIQPGHKPNVLIGGIGILLLAGPLFIGYAAFQIWPTVEETAKLAEIEAVDLGPPVINAIERVADEEAETVALTINGTGFDPTGKLSVGGVSVLPDSITTTTITATIAGSPDTAGDVVVTNSDSRSSALPGDSDSTVETLSTPVSLFGIEVHVTPGQSYLLLTMAFGLLGAYVHTATSFSTYVGNGRFKASWGWWYAVRGFIGAGVAMVLVVGVLGGLVAMTSSSEAIDPKNLNPYTVAAFAALAGWFSKTAADKLEEIFETVLANAKDHLRQDKLYRKEPEITSQSLALSPDGKTATLVVTGTGFTKTSKLTVDGIDVGAKLDGAGTTLTADLDPAPKPGLPVAVTNESVVTSQAYPIIIPPQITSVNPAAVPAGSATQVKVKGRGFKSPAVMIDDDSVEPTSASETELTVPVPALSKAAELVVANPDGGRATAAIAVAPAITSVEPGEIAPDAASEVMVNGSGFHDDATATVGMVAAVTSEVTATTLKVAVQAITAASEIAITNPDGSTATVTLGVHAPSADAD